MNKRNFSLHINNVHGALLSVISCKRLLSGTGEWHVDVLWYLLGIYGYNLNIIWIINSHYELLPTDICYSVPVICVFHRARQQSKRTSVFKLQDVNRNSMPLFHFLCGKSRSLYDWNRWGVLYMSDFSNTVYAVYAINLK